MKQRRYYSGGCHCGALSIRFETSRSLSPRECDCSFCRKHGATMLSDPKGRIVIHWPSGLEAYRFGTKSADFLICQSCGVYVGASFELDGSHYSIVNLHALSGPPDAPAPLCVSYDAETVQERIERRKRAWTPTDILDVLPDKRMEQPAAASKQ